MIDELFRCELRILCMSDEINGFLIAANIPELEGRISYIKMRIGSEDLRHRKPG